MIPIIRIKSDGSLETEEVFTPIPTDIIITCDQPLSIEESEFLNKVMSSVKKSPDPIHSGRYI